MAAKSYDRLSAQDRSFLAFESPSTPMNVGGVALFDSGPLATPEGGVDVERIKRFIASRLHVVPRYRQRLAYVPLEERPIWVDDERFDLDYHVRHIALPKPGSGAQLKRLAADILCRPLDRTRALWELWVVEGLEGSRFALVTKVHHCMVDGISGVALSSVMMRTDADTTIEPPRRWTPRRVPGGIELLRNEVLQRVRLPSTEELRRNLDPRRLRSNLGEQLAAVRDAMSSGLQSAAETPLNQPIGAYRRFDWLDLSLAEMKEVKNRLGGTVNDVVLATVAGAVRRFFKRRRFPAQGVEFRVAVPVNMRAPEERRILGNRVSIWFTQLPIHESDPRRRLAKVRATTAQLKGSKQALGTQALMQLAEWTGSTLITFGARLATRVSPYNLIVTNVPGPQFPLYLVGARMLGAYGLVPLWAHQGMGVALFSYDGRMCWGFNGDWDVMHDLPDFVADIEASFAELRAAARQPARAARKRRRDAGAASA